MTKIACDSKKPSLPPRKISDTLDENLSVDTAFTFLLVHLWLRGRYFGQLATTVKAAGAHKSLLGVVGASAHCYQNTITGSCS
jgi:hypothetical protein